MTITDSHRDAYQSTVSEFRRQTIEDTCLPVSIYNILSELESRHKGFNPDLSLDDILDYCDYKPGFGSSAEYLPTRLDPVLADQNYSINIESEIEIDDLRNVIADGDKSYPLVELDPLYFEYVEGYEVQTGQFATALPHIIIPHKFNSDTVLYFDPYEDYYSPNTSEGAPPREMPQIRFYELWSGKAKPRWSLWLERSEQQTFDKFTEDE